MKEFVEKLIGRLEECKKIEKCNLYSGIEEGFGYSHCSDAFEDGQTLGAFNAYSNMLDFIKELAEEYNNGWIPCSERLPDKSMCTDDSGFVTVETTEVLENGEGVTFIEDYSLDTKEFCTPYKVIAWRNRPQPYQPKGE